MARNFLYNVIHLKVIPCHFLKEPKNEDFTVLVAGVPLAALTHREIELVEEKKHVHELGGQGWSFLVHELGLIGGTRVILTNILNNTLSLMPFDESGMEMRSEIVPRMELNWRKPFKRSPIDDGMLMNVYM